uniref:Uncharacterized protein n=1 Tax=viral metagenome TaxID=1070528 RepID=A0A6M3JNY3_9ZZZZ
MIRFSVEKNGEFTVPEGRNAYLNCPVKINGEEKVMFFQEQGRPAGVELYKITTGENNTKTQKDYDDFGIELDPVMMKEICDEGYIFLENKKEADKKEKEIAKIKALKEHPLFTIVMPQLRENGYTVAEPNFKGMWDANLNLSKDGIEISISSNGNFWVASSGSYDGRVEKKFKKILDAPAKVEVVFTTKRAQIGYKKSNVDGLKELGDKAAKMLPFKTTVEVKEEWVRSAYDKKSRNVTRVRLTDEKGRVFSPSESGGKVMVSLVDTLTLSPEKMGKVIAILNEV